jgi:hypothetical protein
MEELTVLVNLLNTLPSLALWVVAAFFGYKVVVIGSVYGVIKLAINKFHDYLVSPPKPKFIDIVPTLDGLVIANSMSELTAQLRRIRGKGLAHRSEYIHNHNVAWLREAIDAKEADDNAKEYAKQRLKEI